MAQKGNTFIEALSALAEHHARWRRPPEEWRPRSHNARRQFSSLARHLLAKYPVPGFLDTVWFKGRTAEAARQQNWYFEIGGGKSPRQLDLPVGLTKRMVHPFLHAPPGYTVEAALRRAQVLGLGGDVRLVDALLGSRLATCLDHDDFWQSVIRWLIAGPALAAAQVGPLVDYLHHQKFGPQDAKATSDQADRWPTQANFSLEGRTPASLLHEMHEWHGELRKTPPQSVEVTWYESGVDEFDWTESTAGSASLRRWTIRELLTRKDLFEEGRAMRHCVAGYEHACVSGRRLDLVDGRRKRRRPPATRLDRRGRRRPKDHLPGSWKGKPSPDGQGNGDSAPVGPSGRADGGRFPPGGLSAPCRMAAGPVGVGRPTHLIVRTWRRERHLPGLLLHYSAVSR